MCRVVGDEVPTPIPFSTCRFQDGVTSRCDYLSFYEANMSKNFFFFEVSIGTDPITHVYKTRIFPVKLRNQIFGYKKTLTVLS